MGSNLKTWRVLLTLVSVLSRRPGISISGAETFEQTRNPCMRCVLMSSAFFIRRSCPLPWAALAVVWQIALQAEICCWSAGKPRVRLTLLFIYSPDL